MTTKCLYPIAAALVYAISLVGCVTQPAPSPGPIPEEIVGKTLLFNDDIHGTQVEYYAADGSAYLWYPGNEEVVRSSYREDTAAGETCFDYATNVFNPDNGEYGGVREWCDPTEIFWDKASQSAEGDIFGLETRTRVPFVLDRLFTTLEALRDRVGA